MKHSPKELYTACLLLKRYIWLLCSVSVVLATQSWATPAVKASRRHASSNKRTAGHRIHHVAKAIRPVSVLPLSTAALLPGVALDPKELAGPGRLIVSLTADLRGRTWVGTESDGVYCYNPEGTPGNKWKQYTTKDGLGDDNAYVLTCDHLGRIWAGHQSHGVSVFNGNGWKNYDQLTGPLGARVFALSVCPVNGDVWVGTEAGLARFSQSQNTWSYYTTLNGLPSNQISALAIDNRGRVYVGTDCEGLAIGELSNNYKEWSNVRGSNTLPNTAVGIGLPSNLINCLLVTSVGQVLVGTPDGLAGSSDRGATWHYIRGSDCEEKTKGLYLNRDSRPSLSAFELIPQETYRRVIATSGAPTANEKWVSVQASVEPTSQQGINITCNGGDTTSVESAINLSGVQHPAPAQIYQSERTGNFSYALSGLVPGYPYVVRLHFAELDFNGPDQRCFDVAINNSCVLRHFDIFREAKGSFKAVVREFLVKPDATGVVTISLNAPLDSSTAAHHTSTRFAVALLSEDYVNSVSEDAAGQLWIGHRQSGLEVRSQIIDQIRKPIVFPSPEYISALLPTKGGGILVGSYAGSLAEARTSATSKSISSTTLKTLRSATSLMASPPFPAYAQPPAGDLLASLCRQNVELAQPLNPGQGAYVGADWVTKGDWVGRYGTGYAVLCAAQAPLDHKIITDPFYSVTVDSGPHRMPGDSVRRWIQWLSTDQERVAYDPIVGGRREAEWDDHGEAYPMSQQGPDLWVTVSVPAGIHRLSAYFVNKDGHDAQNRCRDYVVDLLPYRSTTAEAEALEPLGRSRVTSFWGGVFNTFIVCGPAKFYLKVGRNNSFNTIVSAVFLDKVQTPRVKDGERVLAWMGGINYSAPVPTSPEAALFRTTGRGVTTDSTIFVRTLWFVLQASETKKGSCQSTELLRLLAYRYLKSICDSEVLLANWRWYTHLWTTIDRKNFQYTMQQAHASVLNEMPFLRRGGY